MGICWQTKAFQKKNRTPDIFNFDPQKGIHMKTQIERSIVAIILLSLCALLVVSQLYIPIPLINMFSQYFSVKTSVAIWIGSGFGFAYAAGFLVFGPLSDRFGRKPLLVPGLFLLGLITFLIGFSTHFYSIITLRLLQGFVAATFAPAALAYIGAITSRFASYRNCLR